MTIPALRIFGGSSERSIHRHQKVEHFEELVEGVEVKISAEEAKYIEESYVPQLVSGQT